MKYYPVLSDDEIRSICLGYPYKDLITGFKKCSKDFSSLLPGRRPQSVSEEIGRNLIANNPRSNLTAKMVEVLLSSWVPNIKALVKEQIADGKSADFAYIIAFSKLGGSSFVKVFFHFSDESFSEDRIAAICAGVEALSAEKERITGQNDSLSTSKQIEEIKRQLGRELKEKDKEIKRITAESKVLTKELTKERETTAALMEESNQIELLQKQVSEASSEIEKLKQELVDAGLRLKAAQDAFEESEGREHALKEEASSIRAELVGCRNTLAKVAQRQKSILDLLYIDTADELRPVDMEEFYEYLSYNLSDVGLDKSKSYYPLLVGFLGNSLFANKPIICNQAVGHSLARCISNTLCGSQNATIVPYKSEITSRDIGNALETDSRILVSDSFIGNYSELELLPILRSAKRKIIIVTAEYDKTIAYLMPEEVLINCTYINASNIPELLVPNGLSEDPSTIKEELVLPVYSTPNRKAQRLCREIMLELGFQPIVANALAEQMASEEQLDGFLAFSAIPYSINAYGISPYNVSDRLNKYAGYSGKCAHKDLLMEWFGNV